jgi:hypothetical protein
MFAVYSTHGPVINGPATVSFHLKRIQWYWSHRDFGLLAARDPRVQLMMPRILSPSQPEIPSRTVTEALRLRVRWQTPGGPSSGAPGLARRGRAAPRRPACGFDRDLRLPLTVVGSAGPGPWPVGLGDPGPAGPSRLPKFSHGGGRGRPSRPGPRTLWVRLAA